MNDSIIKADKKAERGFTIGILLWNILAWTYSTFLWNGISISKNGNSAFIAVMIILPLIGLIGVPFVIKVLMLRLKFGKSVFRMKPVPGVIGGYLEGVIEIPVRLEPLNGFDLELSCIQRIMDGKAEDVIWHVKKNIAQSVDVKDEKRSVIPVRFGIPYEGVEENPCKGVGYNTVRWRLEAKAELPGLDYRERFEVPVRKTAESSPDFADLDKEEFLSKDGFHEKLETLRIRMEKTGKSETIFIFPVLRNIGPAMSTTIFAIIWPLVFIGFFLIRLIPFSVMMLFCSFDLFALLLCSYLLFFRSRVIITDRKLQLKSGVFFTRHREYDFDNIKIVSFEAVTKAGVGKLYYGLNLELKSGAKKTLANMIPDRMVAERLADEMNKLINK